MSENADYEGAAVSDPEKLALTAREWQIVSTIRAYGPMSYGDAKALVGITGQEVTHLLYVAAVALSDDRYLYAHSGREQADG
jgi:hypothetical protein